MKTEAGDTCSICNNGLVCHKFHTIGETLFENYRCDMCGARFCMDCGGTLNVRGSTSLYINQCKCEEGEELVDKKFVFSDEDLEALEEL